MAKIQVLNREVSIALVREEDHISLTDIAKHRNADDPRFIIQNWMRTRFTVEFLGIWECLNNPGFNRVEFEAVKNEAGSNAFVMTPTKWAGLTGAIGILSKAGRYGGTYAHKDIAFEFASWISVEFKLYLIKEFQRLKEQERQTLGWDIRRNLAKINYRIHTDAIQQHLIPPALNASQTSQIYASEADVLNLALFGQTAAQWRDANPDKTRKHARRRRCHPTGLPLQPRKPQCPVHCRRHAPATKAATPEPDRHSPDDAGGR